MDFRILGPLEVFDDDRPLALGGARQRALLGMLLLHANEVVSSDHLIDGLWGGGRVDEDSKALQVAVSRLRKALEPSRAAGEASSVVITRPPGYELHLEPDQLDLARFERLVAEGRAALAEADPAEAAGTLREALALWRGPALADLAFESFSQEAIARLEELRLSALDDRVEADLALGLHADLIPELRGLVGAHPLRERPRAQLILALYRSGRQAEALDSYTEARRALVELGIEPGRALQRLQEAVLAQDPSLDPPPLPAQAPRPGEGVAAAMVGREREIDSLTRALGAVFAGRGRLVFLAGEPGIGKSRLAEELAVRARARGARVLWGRCWEAGGAPAYWPWVQSLRGYVRDRDRELLRDELGVGAAEVAQIVPDVRELFPDAGEPPSPDSEGARFRLFDSTASFLRRASESQPLVLVIDDLHVADPPSLLLLRFLAREVGEMRVMILGAYRDTEVSDDHPLARTLAETARERDTERLSLEGLPEDDVARFIEISTGKAPAPGLVSAIHGKTDGSPLFVGELVRLLAHEGRLANPAGLTASTLPVPRTVRDVIGQRLQQLSDECRHLLSLASVLGRDFSFGALQRVSEENAGTLLELVDEAVRARVVLDLPGSPGGLRFSHALVRDVLYDGLAPGERARLHRLSGEALEAIYAHDPEPHLTELAHHFAAAAAGGEADKAIGYAWRAGDRAARLLAYEEAVRLYRMAIEAQTAQGQVDERDRCELLLALGEAQARAGDASAAKETFAGAADTARKLSLPEQFGQAALGFEGRLVWPRATDERTIPLLLEARALLEGDSALKVAVVARLCGALRAEPSRHDEGLELSKEVVAAARRLGDPATIAYAFEGRYAALSDDVPEQAGERLSAGTEMANLGHASGEKERAWSGHFARLIVLSELGDRQAVDAEIEKVVGVAEGLRQPAQLNLAIGARGVLALLEGRLEAAEELIGDSLRIGERAWAGSLLYSRLQLWALRRHQSRLAEVRESIERCAVEFPERSALCRCVLAHLYAELGAARAARSVFDELAEGDFEDVSHNSERLADLGLLAEVAAMLGDLDRAHVLYRLLLPAADRNAVDLPELFTGAVARNLGILAAETGNWEEAASHFESALEMNERFRAWPWLAHTELAYSRMLVARGRERDRRQSLEMLSRAHKTFAQLDMAGWAQRASG